MVSPTADVKVAVVGAGALGTVLGVLLHGGGTASTVLTRRRKAAESAVASLAVRDETTDELRIRSATPALVHIDNAEGPFDVVLLLQKSMDTEWAVELAGRIVASDGIVLSLQNGLRTVDFVESLDRGVAGTTYQGAGIDGDGTVVWTLLGPTLAAPRPHLADDTARLAGALDRPEVPVSVVPDRDVMIWTKLVAAISNSLSGALLLPVHELSQADAAWDVLDRARSEALDVAEALGVVIDRAALEAGFAARPKDAARSTVGSTYQSLVSGRATEVPDISGAVVEAASRLGMAAPYNDLLGRLVAVREELAGLRP